MTASQMTTSHYHIFMAAKKEGEQIYFAFPSTAPFAWFYASEKGNDRKALEELTKKVVYDARRRSAGDHAGSHFSVSFTYTPPYSMILGLGNVRAHELDRSLHQTFSDLVHEAYQKMQEQERVRRGSTQPMVLGAMGGGIAPIPRPLSALLTGEQYRQMCLKPGERK